MLRFVAFFFLEGNIIVTVHMQINGLDGDIFGK